MHATKRAYIAPVSWGLGDLIVSLPAIQGLINSGMETILVTRSGLQEGLAERIAGLAGALDEETFLSAQPSEDHIYLNMRDHPIQSDYWWGSPEFACKFPGWGINDIIHKICQDMEIPHCLNKLIPLKYEYRPDCREKLVLIPGSDGDYKCWPSSFWVELSGKLKLMDMDVVVVGQPDSSRHVHELIETGLPWLRTAQLGDALDVISSCRGVVAVDTGLMHLAVHQGVKTTALFRPDPVYLRSYPHVASITAESCDAECIKSSLSSAYNDVLQFKNWQHKSWSCHRPPDKHCMTTISVDTVLDQIAIQHKLRPRSFRTT